MMKPTITSSSNNNSNKPSTNDQHLTALVGNFLSKYDETATTGLERLCILLEKDIINTTPAAEVSSSATTTTSVGNTTLAMDFVKNEQILGTFFKLQTRPKVDAGLYWNAIIMLILGHRHHNPANIVQTRKLRIACIQTLTSDLHQVLASQHVVSQDDDNNNNDKPKVNTVKNEILFNLKKVLSNFEPENQDHKKKNTIPIEHVEKALQLCTILLQYTPYLLSSKLNYSSNSSNLNNQKGNNKSVSFDVVTGDHQSSTNNNNNNNQNSDHQQQRSSSSSTFKLPFEHFPLFTATWFPSWCATLRELRAEYFLTAISHPNTTVATSSILQSKLLSTALLDPVNLALSNKNLPWSIVYQNNKTNDDDGATTKTTSSTTTSGARLLGALLETILNNFVNANDGEKVDSGNNKNSSLSSASASMERYHKLQRLLLGDSDKNNSGGISLSLLENSASAILGFEDDDDDNNNENRPRNSSSNRLRWKNRNIIISLGQKCEILRTQQTLPRLLTQCLSISNNNNNNKLAALAEYTLKSMIDNIAEQNSNYLLAAELGGGGGSNTNSSMMMTNNDNSADGTGAAAAPSGTSINEQQQRAAATTISSLLDGGSASSSSSTLSRGRMPNYWMLALLRHLSPEKRATDANLTCYILSQHPELFRPYIVRVSSHLNQGLSALNSSSSNSNNNQQQQQNTTSLGVEGMTNAMMNLVQPSSSSSATTLRVAICNALSRILCTPLPFHLTSTSVANLIVASNSTTTTNNINYRHSSSSSSTTTKATHFYDLTPEVVVDEICPSWMAEFCHKIILNFSLMNSNNNQSDVSSLEYLFVLQVVRAALQRAIAVRSALQKIFDHRERMMMMSSKKKNKQDENDDSESDGDESSAVTAAHNILSEASEWAAEAQFLTNFDHLLSSRLPKIETIISRLQKEILPRLNSNNNDSLSVTSVVVDKKLQLLAQRSFDVIESYLPAFDRPISVLASLPTATSFFEYQTSLVSSVVSVVKTSFLSRVDHLSRLHHVDNNNNTSSSTSSSISLIGELFQWAIVADRFLSSDSSTSSAIASSLRARIQEIRELFVLVVKSVIVDVSSSNETQTASGSVTNDNLALQEKQLLLESEVWLSSSAVFGSSGSKNNNNKKKNNIDQNTIQEQSRSFVMSLLLVINFLLTQSKSKAADSVAKQLHDDQRTVSCGLVFAAASNYIAKRNEKNQQKGTSMTPAEQTFSTLLSSTLQPILKKALTDIYAEQQQLSGTSNTNNNDDDLLLASYQQQEDTTSASSNNTQQQHLKIVPSSVYSNPASTLSNWSEHCSLGVLAQQHQDLLSSQQQQDGTTALQQDSSSSSSTILLKKNIKELRSSNNVFFSFIIGSASSSSSSSFKTFSALVTGKLESVLPYPSSDVLSLLNVVSLLSRGNSKNENNNDFCCLDQASIEQLASDNMKAKTCRKALTRDLGWLNDPFSVWHVANILMKKVSIEEQQQQQQQSVVDGDGDDETAILNNYINIITSKDSWTSVCLSILQSWKAPVASSTNNQHPLTRSFNDFLAAASASLISVCVQSLLRKISKLVLGKKDTSIASSLKQAVFGFTIDEEQKQDDSEESSSSSLSYIQHVIVENGLLSPSFYQGTQSFTDRMVYSLCAQLLKLSSTASSPSFSVADLLASSKRFYCLSQNDNDDEQQQQQRFPELHLLHSIFDNQLQIDSSSSSSSKQHQQQHDFSDGRLGSGANEAAMIQSILSNMNLGLNLSCTEDNNTINTNTKTSSSSSSSLAFSLASNVFGNSGSLNKSWMKSSATSCEEILSAAVTHDKSLFTSTDLVDPRFLLSLIHTVLSVRIAQQRKSIPYFTSQQQQQKQSQSQLVPTYYCNKSLPFLLRMLSCSDAEMRSLALDCIALSYNGLHPLRKIFVDSVIVAMNESMRKQQIDIFEQQHQHQQENNFPAFRLPCAVSSALLNSITLSSNPNKSIFESIGTMLCEEVSVVATNNRSSSSLPIAIMPFHDSLFSQISTENLMQSGVPVFDTVKILQKFLPATTTASSSLHLKNQNQKQKQQQQHHSSSSVKLLRTDFNQEIDFVLRVLMNSCCTGASTSNDFTFLLQSGIITHLLSFFHVACDFGGRAVDILNTVVTCLIRGGPVNLSTSTSSTVSDEENNNKTRTLFAQNFLQWILSSIEMYSASSSSSSLSSMPHVASFLTNALMEAFITVVDHLFLSSFVDVSSPSSTSSHSLMKTQNKPLHASLKAIFAQLISWLSMTATSSSSTHKKNKTQHKRNSTNQQQQQQQLLISFPRLVKLMEMLFAWEKATGMVSNIVRSENNNNKSNKSSSTSLSAFENLIIALKDASDAGTARTLGEFLKALE